ncbi:regulator of nonsense transcripts 3B isoform X2 [Halyomorpha halys]|uniref:regulator of nonsense transcripts 3B isoform X2 n=1 Tax=Halyomorpha halys TaxID=286706 RepID=UPI0006D4D434|nr:regulator of nonsense transcripts 3B isoform X2 [Halyomorpha halys]
MEEEEPSSELINSTTIVEVSTPKDVGEDDLVSLDKTIQIENSSLKTSPREPVEATNPPENLDNKRRKVKEEKPHSKIVVRRLPPTMTKEMFLDQVSPLPEVDYMYYIQGDTNNGFNPFSRAYLNFINQDDLFSFSRTFDNYVFLDAKGQEYPAVVEFAMFQRVPKQRPKKKDPLMGTIESDPTYITFKENLLAEALENSKTGGKAVKQHYFETEISTAEEVNTTPLLEFLKVRRAEKARIREERREEKKRKELERKLKQKTKDKKGEGDDEEPSKEAKIQHKPSEKDPAKEVNIERNKQVGDNEKLGKESFDKSNVNFKKESSEKPTILQDQKFLIFNKSDKVEQQNENESQSKDAEVQKIKEAEQQTMYLRKLLGLLPSDSQLSASKKEVLSKDKRDNKERDSRNVKKKDDKERVKDTRIREFKSRGGKSYQEERLRLAERREEQKKRDLLNSGDKKTEFDLGEADPGEGTGEQPKAPEEKTSRFEKKKYEYRKKYDNDDWKDEKKRSRNERSNLKRDGRERKDDYRRNQDKKTSDSDLRRKVKTFKNSEFSKVMDDKKKSSAVHEEVDGKVQEGTDKNKIEKKDSELSKDKWKSVDDLVLTSTVERKNSDKIVIENNDVIVGSKKRHSSLENLRHEEKCPVEPPPKKVTLLQREKKEPKESKDRSRKDLSSHKPMNEAKMYSHKKKERFHEKQEDKDTNEPGSKSRDHESEGNCTKSKDVPRSDRRIRNKDRPSIEIYRPGMGKFSKQRLEKEKALGSSTEVDSPSHSPSPTPKTKVVT